MSETRKLRTKPRSSREKKEKERGRESQCRLAEWRLLLLSAVVQASLHSLSLSLSLSCKCRGQHTTTTTTLPLPCCRPFAFQNIIRFENVTAERFHTFFRQKFLNLIFCVFGLTCLFVYPSPVFRFALSLCFGRVCYNEEKKVTFNRSEKYISFGGKKLVKHLTFVPRNRLNFAVLFFVGRRKKKERFGLRIGF